MFIEIETMESETPESDQQRDQHLLTQGLPPLAQGHQQDLQIHQLATGLLLNLLSLEQERIMCIPIKMEIFISGIIMEAGNRGAMANGIVRVRDPAREDRTT